MVEPPFNLPPNPKENPDALNTFGVFSTKNRNTIMWGLGQRLPHMEWSAEFVRRLPKEISEANRKYAKDSIGGVGSPDFEKNLLKRYGSLWFPNIGYRVKESGDTPTGERIVCVNSQGDAGVKVVPNPKPEHVPNPRPNPPGERHAVGELRRAGDDKDHLGKQVKGRGGLPKWDFTNKTANFDTGAAVNILPPDPNLYPSGCIQNPTDSSAGRGVFQPACEQEG